MFYSKLYRKSYDHVVWDLVDYLFLCMGFGKEMEVDESMHMTVHISH